MAAAPIRVALVEDDPGSRQGLASLVAGAPGFALAGAFEGVEVCLARFDGQADVLLMDIQLGGVSGIEGVGLMRARYPALPVVMMTAFGDAPRVFEALKAGAVGYLLKRTPAADLLAALADVREGGAPMSSTIARMVVASFHTPTPSAPTLSAREREVLHLLASGYRYREIGEALFISVETVRSHLRRIYEKLHVRTRTEAVARYMGSR